MPHVVDIPTRWGDMDAQAHLNNAVYVDFLQDARVDFLHSASFGHLLGGEDDPDHSGNAILVVGHRVEYLRPVVHGQKVQVRLWVESVGAARFVVAYEISADGELAVRARTVLCNFDRDAQQIRRFDPVARAAFVEAVESGDPLRELPAMPEFQAEKAFRTPLQVRWSDVDRYGHVNNVRYYDYAQEARIEMMRQLGDGLEVSDSSSDSLWLLVRQDVDYLGQLKFRTEPYSALTVVERIGGSSFSLQVRMMDEQTGTVFANARTVLVHADAQGRPTPLSDAARQALEPHLLEPHGG